MEKKMCSKCKNPNGECKLRHIAHLYFQDPFGKITREYIGGRIGISKTKRRLREYIHENEKFFAQFATDLSYFSLPKDHMRTLPASSDSGWQVWIEITHDPDFGEIKIT